MRSDATLAGRAERERLQLADADHRGAARDGFQDVRAAHEAAVDDELGFAARDADDLGQELDRAAAVIELAAAVIRHVDDVDAVLHAELGVLGRLNALHHQRQLDGAS